MRPDEILREAIAAHQAGKIPEAERLYRQLLLLQPRHALALHYLGMIAYRAGDFAGAAALIRRSIAIDRKVPEAHNNLGSALKGQGALAEAVVACREAIRLRAAYPEAHYNLGTALQALGRLDDAEAAYRRAIGLQPGNADACNNLGIVLHRQWRLGEAVGAYRQAIAQQPRHADALNNLAIALRDQGNPDEAIATCQQALALQPGFADAWYNLGNAQKDRGRPAEAIAAYRQAVRLRPGHGQALAQLISQCQYACDWRTLAADRRQLAEQPDSASPFVFLADPAATMEGQLRVAIAYAEGLAVRKEDRLKPRSSAPHDRIRLGYLSADFRQHPVAQLIVGLLERHDRTRFDIRAYSYGRDDGSALRGRIAAAVDGFTDIAALPHRQAAARIHDDALDILVDLTGYTQFARPEILAYRPAPVQVNYLGYPGTMGADFIDYVIADRVITPMADQPWFHERIVQLPGAYQPSDTTRRIGDAPTRRQVELPERGFVFCCFNNSYKITPEVFTIWMELLSAVPGSVLWLLDAAAPAPENLRREALSRGVDPARLVFAPRLPLPDHLARHRLADLFLDTMPYNAHTTANDALWAGLPVLTCAGKTFAGRVAESLLRAAGLPELTASSPDAYRERALDLARNPAQLAALRGRTDTPLFDMDGFARGIEAAYTTIHERWRAGKSPQAFAV